MKRAFFVLALGAVAAPLTAQSVNFGVQGVFADYRELGPSLSYNGGGLGGIAELNWHKFSGDLQVASITFNPSSGSAATDKFKSTQIDTHLRWFLANGISLGRPGSPSGPSAPTSRLRTSRPSGPACAPIIRWDRVRICCCAAITSRAPSSRVAARLRLRWSWGSGSRWGAGNGRWRITGDYEFQRIDRKTSVKVPIQQALARVGGGGGTPGR